MHIIHFGFHMRTSPQTKITIGFNTLLSGARNTVTRQHNFPSPIHFMREASNILSCSFIAFIPTRESFICYSYEPSSITFTFFRIFFSFSVLFFSFLFFLFFLIFVFIFSIIYTRSLPEIYVEIDSKFVISMGSSLIIPFFTIWKENFIHFLVSVVG